MSMRSHLVLALVIVIVMGESCAQTAPVKPRSKPKEDTVTAFQKFEMEMRRRNVPALESIRLTLQVRQFGADSSSSSSSGVGDACSDSSSGSGTCVDTSQGCNGNLVAGFCPGDSNVECCVTNWGSCPGGQCITTDACAAQGGTSTPGECPGASNVQCCTSGGPAPPPPSSGGNIQATVDWANSNCGSSQGWECAEFAARAIAAGGFISGLGPEDSTDVYADWDGYNLRLVSELHDYLVSIGWSEEGTDPNSVQAGWPIFGCAGYCPSGGWEHACIGVGSNTIDCHNAEQCQVSASGDFGYYGCTACEVNSILSPP